MPRSKSGAGRSATDRKSIGFLTSRLPVFLVLLTAAFPFLAGLSSDEDFPHGDFMEDCELCHEEDNWLPVRVSSEFDHRETAGFPLRGVHATVKCLACHKSLEFNLAEPECSFCHQDVHLGELGLDCSRCHTSRSFIDRGRFVRMHTETRMPLAGMHLSTECSDCHEPAAQGHLTWVSTPYYCDRCHLEEYQNTSNPDHIEAGFPTDCEQCHTPVGWSPAGFNHSSGSFPLTGGHRWLSCEACHADGRYEGTPTDCYVCHRSDYEGTTDPDHQAAGYPTDCTECHNTNNWDSGTSDHTGFPLTGGHRDLDCSACHQDGQYEGTPTDCYSCHQSDYNGTTDPNHQSAGYPTDCTQCHTTDNWDSDAADHSEFPLTGEHRSLDCSACHQNGQYEGTPTDCYACHREDYEGTSDPNHAAAGYSTDCAACHDTSGWESGSSDHSGFPLTGGHGSLDCAACHGNGQYEGTPTDCYACHREDYEGTTDPNHAAEGYPTDCLQCHDTGSWDSGSTDHTSFPLTGSHSSLDCSACHQDGQYSGTPTDCYACHRDDYEGSRNPDHAAAGIPTDCIQCHDTTTWGDGRYEHSNFPLTGQHGVIDCTACHTDGQFNGTPTDCYACHRDDYDGTDDPNHEAAGFSTDCAACHTTSDWESDFEHSDFPLTGGHSGIDCTACHTDGQYSGTPTDCYACHRDDYEGAQNPDHAEAGIPTDCAACHDTSGWGDGQFNHETWPLTGSHRFIACTACHINGQFAGTPTDCYDCHRDDYEDADDHVSDGYPTDCTECHNTSDWDDNDNRLMKPRSPMQRRKPKPGRHRCTPCHVSWKGGA